MFEAQKSLKQRLVFSKKNGLQLLSHILPMEAKKLKNGGISQIRRIATMVRFA